MAKKLKHRDVRRMRAEWPIKGEDKVHAYKWTSCTKAGFHYDPVAVVDLRPEAIERMVQKAAQALKVARYESIRSYDGQDDKQIARAVLQAVLGRLPAPQPPDGGK